MRLASPLALPCMLVLACTASSPQPARVAAEVVVPEAPITAPVAPPAPVVIEAPRPEPNVVATEELAADAALPPGFPKGVKRIVGKRFHDSLGEHEVVLAERRGKPGAFGTTITLYGQGLVRDGDGERILWKLRVTSDGCPYRDVRGLLGAVLFTDNDHDGAAEVSLLTSEGCLTHAQPIPLRQRMFIGAAAHEVVAHATAEGFAPPPSGSPPSEASPAPLLAANRAAWTALAAGHYAESTTGLPPALPGDLLAPAQSIVVEEKELARTRGGVEVRLEWSKLKFRPTWLAEQLTAELAATAGKDNSDHDWNTVGADDGDCTVDLATSQMASAACSRLVDTRSRREQAEGTGGSPADPDYTYWNVWLFPGLPPIDPLDFLGDAPALGACAPLLAARRFYFTNDGLQLDARPSNGDDEPLAPGCEEEPRAIDWEDMKPRTARARHVIAEMLGPTEPATAESAGESVE